MKRIGPGLYDDEQGGLHLAVDELLRAHGYADTPANRRQLEAAARELIEAQYGIPVTLSQTPIGPTEDE